MSGNTANCLAANPQPMVFDLETLRLLAVNDANLTHYGFSDEFLV